MKYDTDIVRPTGPDSQPKNKEEKKAKKRKYRPIHCCYTYIDVAVWPTGFRCTQKPLFAEPGDTNFMIEPQEKQQTPVTNK